MSEKRKDNKGRILRTGESQRKDLIYQYRYTDPHGKRQTVYAPDLNALREKEKKIQRDLDDGIDYSAGEVPVIDLLSKYTNLKSGVKHNTVASYDYAKKIVKEHGFGYLRIKDIKESSAKQLMIDLKNSGKSYNTIDQLKKVLKPAFQLAVKDDVIRKNPFDFSLSEVIKNDGKKRIALTEEQQEQFMSFIKADATYNKHYDEYTILLKTGMRVSEFCGLTLKDLDFENRRIYVNHQLLRTNNSVYYISDTKSESGVRIIPMSDDVYTSFRNIVENRKSPKIERIIDGYSGFVSLTRSGKPKAAVDIQYSVRNATRKYNRMHPENMLPDITPHVFRHTFCSNMANSGMSIKSLQYLMGHSESSITLDVYAHSEYSVAENEMAKILHFKPTNGNMEQKIV
jgi:integrase